MALVVPFLLSNESWEMPKTSWLCNLYVAILLYHANKKCASINLRILRFWSKALLIVFVRNDGEVGFVELDLVDFGWGVHHEVYAIAVLWEGDDIANVVFVFQNHEDAV